MAASAFVLIETEVGKGVEVVEKLVAYHAIAVIPQHKMPHPRVGRLWSADTA